VKLTEFSYLYLYTFTTPHSDTFAIIGRLIETSLLHKVIVYIKVHLALYVLFFFFPHGFCVWGGDWNLGFEFRASCKAGTLLLEPYLQSILVWLFWRWDLENSAQIGF
jgi:hypothetical protein